MRMPPLALVLALPLAAQVQGVKETARPAAISDQVGLVAPGWAGRIPPAGDVNVPGFLKQLAPGQGFALAVSAEGKEGEALLEGRTLDVKITSPAGVAEFKGLKASALRRIKPTGFDFSLRMLEAAGIAAKDRAALEASVPKVAFAVFETGWQAPEGPGGEVRIEAVLGGTGTRMDLKPATLALRSWEAFAQDQPLDLEAVDGLSKGYHEAPEPGRLLAVLRAVAGKPLESPSVHSFLAFAFARSPLAWKAAQSAITFHQPEAWWALVVIQRLNGEDIGPLMEALPAEVRGRAEAAALKVPPLGDPRNFAPWVDPVDPQRVGTMGVQMDHCWGAWMATGDPSYLRAMVGLLAGAPDFPAYQAWLKARSGLKGLDARVARGMAYQIGGWSLAAFQRADPRVADWLRHWERDPAIPEALREQIRSLPTHKAFERPKEP